MKAVADRILLLDALKSANLAVEKKTTIPVLTNFKIALADQTMTVMGTDLELAIEQSVPAAFDEPFTILLPAELIVKFLSASKSPNVEVEVIDGGRTITEACTPCKGVGSYPRPGSDAMPCATCEGRGENSRTIHGRVRVTAGAAITLESMSPDSFPGLPPFGSDDYPLVNLLETTTTEWNDMVGKTAYAISSEESRFTLNGFLLEISNRIRMVATDSHRLTLVERGQVDFPKGSKKSLVLIPKWATPLIAKIFGKRNEPLTLLRTAGDKNVHYLLMVCGRTIIVARLMTGNFPDWERVMPNYTEVPAKANAKDLIMAIDGIKQCACDRSNAIRLKFNCTGVTLLAGTEDKGEAEMEVPCACNGASGVEIGVDWKYLREFLSTLPKDDAVLVSIRDAKSALGFRSGLDPDYRSVIMPMRI